MKPLSQIEASRIHLDRKDQAIKDINELIKNKTNDRFAVKHEFGFISEKINKYFNPKPLNLKFRQQFNLTEDFKLVYLVDNERLFLILHSLINTLFPIAFVLLVIFLFAELTGRSKVSEAIEMPIEFMGFLSVWLVTTFIIARLSQKATVYRIYFNNKENKFALVKIQGILKFAKEEFTPKDVRYRFSRKVDNDNNNNIKNIIIENLTRNQGNVYINNKLRQINFNLFQSSEITRIMVGPEAYENIKLSLKKQI